MYCVYLIIMSCKLNIVYLCSTSVATTLGSLSVSEQTLVFMKDRKIISEVITDKECIDACVRFVGKTVSGTIYDYFLFKKKSNMKLITFS